MTNTLRRCNDCGYVTVYRICGNNAAHHMRDLSEAEANNYVRIGHDAFRELPDPQPVSCPVRASVVAAFKAHHAS